MCPPGLDEMLAALSRIEAPGEIHRLPLECKQRRKNWAELQFPGNTHAGVDTLLPPPCPRSRVGVSHPRLSPCLDLPAMDKEAVSVRGTAGFWGLAVFQKRQALSLNLKFPILPPRHSGIKQLVCRFIKHMGNHHLFYLGQGAAVGRICQVFVSGFSCEQKFTGKWQVTEEKVSRKIQGSANLGTFNMVNIVPCT